MPNWFAALFGPDKGYEVVEIEIRLIKSPEDSAPLNEKNVKLLAQSFSAVGILHPPYVKPDPSGSGYLIVSGRHRISWFESRHRQSPRNRAPAPNMRFRRAKEVPTEGSGGTNMSGSRTAGL